ncbi:hypothetical protein PVAP13_2KG196736, partial [Panicum virgatum]
MDPLDTLAVRFHLGGEFLNDGKKLHYCGGKEAMSDIDRDKISLPELVGHLRKNIRARAYQGQGKSINYSCWNNICEPACTHSKF